MGFITCGYPRDSRFEAELFANSPFMEEDTGTALKRVRVERGERALPEGSNSEISEPAGRKALQSHLSCLQGYLDALANKLRSLLVTLRDRNRLQSCLDALASPFGATGMTVHEVIGHAMDAVEIREGVPKDLRCIRLPGIENLPLDSIDDIVANAEAFAECMGDMGSVHRIPKLWRESDLTVLSRNGAESASHMAGELASAISCLAEDVAASDLAAFFTTDPFSTDFGEIEKVLTADTAAEGIAPELVEHLAGSAEHRQQVQALCEQIRELNTLRQGLARILRDPSGWGVEKRLKAARVFAIRNRNQIWPDGHCTRVAELERQVQDTDGLIGPFRLLPRSWTRRARVTLRAIRDDAARLMAFPASIRAIRRADRLRQASTLATEIALTSGSLMDELAGIRVGLPEAGNHDSVQIRSAARAIAKAGVFRLFSGEYKTARETYRELLGGSAKDDRQVMARRLHLYADWLDRRRVFEGDIRFSTVFGELFNGLDTNRDDIAQLCDFYACCQDIAKDDLALQWVLETGDLAAVATVSRSADVPELSFAALESRRQTQAQALDDEKGLLKAAYMHISSFKNRKWLLLAEIDEIVALKDLENALTDLIATSEAASVLGSWFAGVASRTDILEGVCTVAELLDDLSAFKERRLRIEQNASELWTVLKLPEKFRSTAGLYTRLADLQAAAANPAALRDYVHVKAYDHRLRAQHFGVLADWVIREGGAIIPNDIGRIVWAVIARNMADRACELHMEALQGYDGRDLDCLRRDIIEKDKELVRLSRNVVRNEVLTGSGMPQNGNERARP